MKIREVKEADYGGLLDLLRELDQDFFPPLSVRGDLGTYLNTDLEKPNITLVLEDNKIITGLISLQLQGQGKDEGYLRTIGVKKRERQQGLGSLLMNKIILKAKKLKYKEIKVRTWSTNKAVIGLYDKFGFVVDYTKKNDRAQGIDSIYYRKQL